MTQVQGKEASSTPIPRAAVGGVRSLVGDGQGFLLESVVVKNPAARRDIRPGAHVKHIQADEEVSPIAGLKPPTIWTQGLSRVQLRERYHTTLFTSRQFL